MKYLMLLSAILLAGCSLDLDVAGVSHPKYLENEYGLVLDCYGELIGDKQNFWQDNNLPKGTTHYVCKDNKAYPINKVTDCQNDTIVNKYGSIQTFKVQNNITVGSNDNIRFICKNGIPVNSSYIANIPK